MFRDIEISKLSSRFTDSSPAVMDLFVWEHTVVP